MKVALTGNFPLQLDEIHGGPQAVLSYLLEGLSYYEDIELHVVTAQKQVAEPYAIEKNGVKFYYLPYPNRTTFLAYPALKSSVLKVIRAINPDLIHSHSAYVFGSISLSSGYPTVITVHDIYGSAIKYLPRRIHRINLHLQHALIRRHFLKNARYIVSINPYIRSYYEPRTKARYFDIDNPVDDGFFKIDPDIAASNQLLNVGFISSLKRPDIALEAFIMAKEEIPDLRLNFAGSVENPVLATSLFEKVRNHQLTDQVKFLGHLPEPEIIKEYEGMTILLHTSILETSPMAIEQAMAAGKVVIASAVGGIPNVVEHKHSGILVEPHDINGFADWIIRLINDPELRKGIGEEARRQALRRFNTDIAAQKTYEMYRKIISDQ
jgi:glycosyltransferase involved in cell wall biosynthesis